MVLSGELKAGERHQRASARDPARRQPRADPRGNARAGTCGLLTSVVNQGVFVRQIDAEEAKEIYDVRSVVFGFICKHLGGRITAEQTQGAGSVSRSRWMPPSSARDNAAYYQLNLRFHDAIADFAAHTAAQNRPMRR